MSGCDPIRDEEDEASLAVGEIVRQLTPLGPECRRRVFEQVCRECGIDPADLFPAEQDVKPNS